MELVKSISTDFRDLIRWRSPNSGIEVLFIAYALFIGIGFTVFGTSLAKSGIPISPPSFLGNIQHMNIKLFTFETFFIFSFFVAVAYFFKWKEKLFSIKVFSLHSIIFVVLAFSLLRLLPDLGKNPILGIRNAAFCWYLFIPIFIWLSSVRVESLEIFARVVQLAAFLVFFESLLAIFFQHQPQPLPEWIPSVGIYFAVAYAFVSRSWMLRILILIPTGFAYGINIFDKFQRTSMLGLFLVLVGVILWNFLFQAKNRKNIIFGALIFAASVFSGYKIWPINAAFIANLAEEKERAEIRTEVFTPFSKAEGNSAGMEKFRLYMWQDAYEKFAAQPLYGIGFQRKVVDRYYIGLGKFAENDGAHEIKTLKGRTKMVPAISGPHNSYLNAVARIGVVGILFVLIHAWAFFALLGHGFYGLATLVFAQGLYAFFNVGLEGPTRSALMIIAIGAALKVAPKGLNLYSLIRPNKQGLSAG